MNTNIFMPGLQLRKNNNASRFIFCLLLSVALPMPAAVSREAPLMLSGVVIEKIERDSALERAGILPGDLVLSWQRRVTPGDSLKTASNPIESFFDWFYLEAEQAQRGGGVQLTIRRNDETQIFNVPPGEWNIRVRPTMPNSVLARYAMGKTLVDGGNPAEGAALWEGLPEDKEISRNKNLRIWLHLRTGVAWEWAKQWDRAQAEYKEALTEAHTSIAQVAVLETAGKTYTAQQSFKGAHASFLRAVEIWQMTFGNDLGTARLYFFLGVLASQHRRIDLEELYLGKAAYLQEKLAPQSFSLGLTLHFLANAAVDKGDLNAAADLIQRTQTIWNKTSPDSLFTASAYDVQAEIAKDRGNFIEHRRLLIASMKIRDRLAPESVDMARSLQNLANLDIQAGDLDTAASRLERALSIREKRDSEGRILAALLRTLANLAGWRGDSALMDYYQKRVLAMHKKISPGSLAVAESLRKMSNSARDRGEIALAWEYGREALLLTQEISPNSFEMATTLNSLAGVAAARNDLELAVSYCRQALEVITKLAPEGTHIPSLLTNMASLEISQGKLDLAEKHLAQALRLWQHIAPGGREAAVTLEGLGEIAHRRGLLDLSQKNYEAALKIQENMAPESLYVLSSLQNLGQVAMTRGNTPEALLLFQRALGIAQRLSPGSIDEATLLHSIAEAYRRSNRSDDALQNYQSAIQVLENQFSRLGGAQDIQAGFGVRYENIYTDLFNLLIEQGKIAEALQVLERSRARSFLSQLEQRDLTWPLDLPLEKQRERRRLRAEYDAIQAEISKIPPGKKGKERAETLHGRLHEIRQIYGEVTSDLYKTNPRFAGLQKPDILDLPRMRQTLDPGTLALFFNVSAERVHLFALSPDAPLRQVTLSLREENLRSDIETLLDFVGKAPLSPALTALRKRSMSVVSARLYDALLGPVKDLIEGSQRLLIFPDGPLHRLPWGLLAMPEPGQGTRHYLIERKPYHLSLSLSVYDEARKLRADRAQEEGNPLPLAAFGNPHFPSGLNEARSANTEPQVRSVADRGFRFDSLPASRGEVERIANLFNGSAQAFLGIEATEENAKALPRKTRIVHFATHSILDERSPLDSAMVLTIPEKFEEGKDNGLLQAWEIFERVRLDADLVVLSACDSGLGKEMGGEGLIGLTRAFQYAGARSVIASLWKISDRTTAELMVRFYKHLKAGLPKDEALRTAQMELIRGPIQVKKENGELEEIDASAPYYWAAFQIYGDWQ